MMDLIANEKGKRSGRKEQRGGMRGFQVGLCLALIAIAIGAGGEILTGQSSSSGVVGAPFAYFRAEPLDIGNEVQFVFDDAVVEDRWRLIRTPGPVLKYAGNPVIRHDKPWEDAVGGTPSVLYDAKLRKYRMWYTSFSLSNYWTKKGPPYYIEYAESADGFNWTKPSLQGFPFAGYAATNVVETGHGKRASGAQVMLNPDQSNPQQRFMMIYLSSTGLLLTYSPDGLYWGPAENRLLKYHSDTSNNLLWVPERRLWYLYCRPSVRVSGMGPLPEGVRHTGRRVALTTSPDLIHWSTPRTILYPDERVVPDYDSAYVFRRHGVFLMLYAVMNQEKGHSEVDTHLATSRDGIHWERMWDRKPLVERGPEGSYDHGEVEPGISTPIELGDTLDFYYYAAQQPQDHWFNETSVGIFRMRVDRFIGQTASDATGYLLTREFVLKGNRLLLNFSSLPVAYDDRTGGIHVEIIQAPDGKTPKTNWETPIAGFTMNDSDRLAGDAVAQPVTWHGNADLSSLHGKAVYLRFKMKRATLYTFQIAP